jgi:hypothetical protein
MIFLSCISVTFSQGSLQVAPHIFHEEILLFCDAPFVFGTVGAHYYIQNRHQLFSEAMFKSCFLNIKIPKVFGVQQSVLYSVPQITFSHQAFSKFSTSEEVVKSAVDSFGRTYGTGRRKTSVARVWIKEGSGQFIVNNRSAVDYFQPMQREECIGPFIESKTAGLFDVWCTVKGGGMSGICIFPLLYIYLLKYTHRQDNLVLFAWASAGPC